MESSAAAEIVESLIQSLKEEPGQFSIELKVVGQSVSVTGGGIGQVITANGGATGSTTIGNKVVVDGSSVEISRGRANQAMTEQMQTLVGVLDKVAAQLRSGKPDKGIITSIMDSLGKTWVPPMVTAVINSAVALIK
jgi:hypothetical protein